MYQIERYLKICLTNQEDFYRKRAEDLKHLNKIYKQVLEMVEEDST